MRKIEPKILQEFELYLRNEERSEATIEKYMHDVRCFVGFIGSAEVNKSWWITKTSSEIHTRWQALIR